MFPPVIYYSFDRYYLQYYNSFVRDCKIGQETRVFHHCNLYGATIGDECLISSFVEIQEGAILHNKVRVGSFSFICNGVEIMNEVFIGSHCCFINDRNPRSFSDKWKLEKTIIEDGVSIGSGSTIMCGITIGKNSFIGAHSLVTKNVPPNELWRGSPARFVKKMI